MEKLMARVHKQINEVKRKLKIKLKIKRKLTPIEATSDEHNHKQMLNLSKSLVSQTEMVQ
jgi:hypothetical protein